ncbi:MAG: pilus assembly protein PilM [Candidatus Omnitrophica bacterium]|nr:pilus assembly protein PilM [Candidatus Omnitrophota bacterium]
MGLMTMGLMTMGLVKSPQVGVIIRQHTVQAISVKRAGRLLRAGQFAQVQISSELDDQQMSQAIRQTLDSCRISAKEMAVSVPGRDVLLRSFNLPLLPKSELEQAIQFEVRKYIPFKAEELAWGYYAEEQRAQKRIGVVFVGIRQERYQRILGWCEGARVKPVLIEAQSVSLARLTPETPAGPEQEFTGLVDAEHDAAHIVIARNQVPYFARDVDLTQPIGASPEPGSPTPEQSGDPRHELLLSEIRLSCDYFTRENPNASIARLLVFGPRELVETWVGNFGQQLPYPVTVGSLPVDARDGSQMSPEQAAAVGLMFRSVKSPAGKLEFLAKRAEMPSVIKARFSGMPALLEAFSPRRLIGPFVSASILALCTVLLGSWLENEHINLAVQHLRETIGAFPDAGYGLRGLPMTQLQQIQQQTEKQLGFLRRVIGQRVPVTERLDALAKALPEGIWLDSLTYQDRLDTVAQRQPMSVSLKAGCFLPATGRELTVIGEFVQKLKKDSRFFQGLAGSQLGEIAVARDSTRRYSFRTFLLTCAAEAL